MEWSYKNCAIIVAHPDDETIWAGGTILMHPVSDWTIITLCRASDPDRAPKFYKVADYYKAACIMADLDDGPQQTPLSDELVQRTILDLLQSRSFDLILTHSPNGEYTRHLRHEETAKAVLAIWQKGLLNTDQLWMFAYEDGHKKYTPKPIDSANKSVTLPEDIWRKKYHIITDIYGFGSDSFEAESTGRKEAFWCFENPKHVYKHFNEGK